MITFPLWFKLFLGFFGLLIITGTIRRLTKNKYIDSVNKLSAEKKEQFVQTNSSLVKITKLFLWISPILLLLIPFILYTYSPSFFFHYFVMMCIVFIIVTDEFLFRRSVLQRIKN